ncbi:MAG: hypothetical protein ACI8V4_002393, partial [Ilumatobacter sp.]
CVFRFSYKSPAQNLARGESRWCNYSLHTTRDVVVVGSDRRTKTPDVVVGAHR